MISITRPKKFECIKFCVACTCVVSIRNTIIYINSIRVNVILKLILFVHVCQASKLEKYSFI